MVQWAIEPTFRVPIPINREMAMERFSSVMRQRGDESLYLTYGEYAEFHLETHMHRLWSPHLSVYFLDSDQPDACCLVGRFAPRPHVWTLIWIFYLAFFCSIFFAGIFGGSQWLIGEFPWGWAIVLATVVPYVGLFVASQIGQSLCSDQMELLRSRLDAALGEAGLSSDATSAA